MTVTTRTTSPRPTLSRRSFLALLAAGTAATALAPSGGALAGPAGAAPGTPALAAARADAADFRALGRVVTQLMGRLGVPGVAVGLLHGDREQAAGFGVTSVEHPLRVDADTLFQIGSVAKTYTGTAIMRLVEAGRLDLDTPVRHWLPGLTLADPAVAAAVTPRHLVTHTGGWFGDYMPDTGAGDDALARYVAGLATLPQQAPLGGVFAYNNAGFSLAGRLIEAVIGLPYEAAIGELLLAPLGLQRSFFFAADAITHATAVGHVPGERGPVVARPWALPRGVNPAGGLIASAREQLAWARFHLGDGAAPSGERLLRPATMALMRSRLGPGGTLGADEIDGVGVAWQLAAVGDARVVRHGGDTVGQHTTLLLVPERRFALVVLTNAVTGALLANEVVPWALRRFLGLAAPPAPPATLPAERLAPYAGRYASPALELGVSADDGVLILRVLDRGVPVPEFPAVRFAPYAEDRFVGLDEQLHGVRCDFPRHPDGTVGWLRFGGRLLVRDAPASPSGRGTAAAGRSPLTTAALGLG